MTIHLGAGYVVVGCEGDVAVPLGVRRAAGPWRRAACCSADSARRTRDQAAHRHTPCASDVRAHHAIRQRAA